MGTLRFLPQIERMARMRIKLVALLIAGLAVGLSTGAQSLPNNTPFPNGSGFLETYNVHNAPISLTGAFFQSLGTNGRSCGSCHRPAEGWSVSAAELQVRFLLTRGLDPIFRPNDGANCDHDIDTSTVEGRRKAYSLLLSRGVIRVSLPVPPGAEFTVENVRNPYGCSDRSTLSVYRRPLPSTNLMFLSTVMLDGRESTPPSTENIPYNDLDVALLADLKHQAIDATTGHAQGAVPTSAQVQDIVDFETSLRTAQAIDYFAGFLNDDGASGGPAALASQEFFIGINDSFPASFNFNPSGVAFNANIFNLYDAWTNSLGRRASIARGQKLFNSKPIVISGVGGINDVSGLPTVFVGTCGTCHDSPNVGDHSISAPLNIGVADVANPLDVAYLPVYTFKNNSTNEIVKTTDPGRALITGKWADIGKFKGPILRGLASRAPYFHNGAAANLADVLTFYEKRFSVSFTAQERADLIAFLNAL
jgi:cytochrome c peroxidase